MSFLIKLFLKLLPKTLKPIIVGIPVIIQNEKKEILLGKRNKNALFYPNLWGLPGGLTTQGEKIKDAAIREVKEEMGINIKITKQSKKVYEILPSKGNPVHTINIPFYAMTKETPKPRDETQEVKWFKPNEIKKMELAYTHKDILKKEGLLK